jgi:hypothetical protein
VREAAFEDAQGFQATVAAGFPSRDHGFGVGMPVGLSERDAVQGRVELPVPGAGEAMAGLV